MVVKYLYSIKENKSVPLQHVLSSLIDSSKSSSSSSSLSSFNKIIYVNNTIPDNILQVTRQLNINQKLLTKIEYEKVTTLPELVTVINSNKDAEGNNQVMIMVDEFHWLIDSQINTLNYNDINKSIIDIIQAGYNDRVIVYIFDDRSNEFIKLLVDEYNEI